MADGFEISPPVLTSAASALAGPTDSLRQKVTAVQSTVTTGNPWGGDEQGTLFGSLYTEVLSKAIEGLASHADQLQYACDNLTQWAQTHEANDQSVAARFGEGAA